MHALAAAHLGRRHLLRGAQVCLVERDEQRRPRDVVAWRLDHREQLVKAVAHVDDGHERVRLPHRRLDKAHHARLEAVALRRNDAGRVEQDHLHGASEAAGRLECTGIRAARRVRQARL
jgi:hypothetical protein